jgi:hypothetical protein
MSLLIFPYSASADARSETADDAALFSLDFTHPREGAAHDWLRSKNFELKRDAAKPTHISLHHDDNRLHIVARRPAFGLAIRPVDEVNASRLRLHWGVADYPEGVSYQHDIDNEAIMVYVFFGKERLPSGEMFVPDSPYFIGFYLCPVGTDEVEQPYVGHHYRKTGRYVCVDHPPEGETVVSEIHLDQEFLDSFGVDALPPVSAVSIEVDTTDADNDGHAAAFIERLDFLD